MIEARDMALDDTLGGDPWWLPLHPSNNPFSFRFQLSPLGKCLTRNILWFMEGIRSRKISLFSDSSTSKLDLSPLSPPSVCWKLNSLVSPSPASDLRLWLISFYSMAIGWHRVAHIKCRRCYSREDGVAREGATLAPSPLCGSWLRGSH